MLSNLHVIRWHRLRGFGSNQAVRWSFIWLIITPLAARLVRSLPDPIVIAGLSIPKFELPFSWMVFYFSALAFSLAGALYYSYCPSIIRNFRDYAEFRESGRTSLELPSLVPDPRRRVWRDRDYHELLQTFAIVLSDERIPGPQGWDEMDYRAKLNMIESLSKAAHVNTNDADVSALYWRVFRSWRKARPIPAALCALLFGVGFAGLLIVSAQGLSRVVFAGGE